MDLKLKDKIIVVAGDAKGIGAGIVRRLALEEAVPVIVGHSEKDNLKLLESIGGIGTQFSTILTDPQQCEAVIHRILQQYHRIDGLINSAGEHEDIAFDAQEGLKQSIHRNLVNAYLITHFALPALKASAGSIVNILYETAMTNQEAILDSGASNGGLMALTREWAVELLKYGIRVNAVVDEKKPTEFRDSMDKPETAAAMASLAVFLLSSVSSHTTGQLVRANGAQVYLHRTIN